MKVVVSRETDQLDHMFKKLTFWKAIRVTAWIARFVKNCKFKKSQRATGPLTTKETNEQKKFWIRRAQQDFKETDGFKDDQQRLSLQLNEEKLYECRGRLQGQFPIYIPRKHIVSEKLVEDAHAETLHGGVGLTMSKIREKYWVPKLRQLSKQIIRKCYGCKRFQARAFANPPTGNLPKERTEGEVPFQVIGIDFAGPIYYKQAPKREGKSYIILYTCSLMRALHLELLPDMTCEEFLGSFKRFIAVRGLPRKVILDNGKTFVAAAKWLWKIMQNERLNDFLAHHEVIWQFNLSRAPWWGGMFERLVGLVKAALYKVIQGAKLTFNELQSILLDIQIILNNRPLSYCEDDIQLPILTPNAMVYGKTMYVLEEDLHNIESLDLRKRERYIRCCKEMLWKRFNTEYLKALRERHNMIHKAKDMNIKQGDVVMIKGEEKNRGLWKIGIIERLIPGRDGVVRAVRLRAGKSHLERPIQHLYPLELQCEVERKKDLDPKAKQFKPTRKTAKDAKAIIKEIAEDEEDEQ